MANALSILAMAAAYVSKLEQQSEAMEFKEDSPRFGIRSARSSDIPLLERVEKSAAEAFRSVDLEFLLDEPTVEVSALTQMARSNHLWIAVNDWDQPIGFLGGENLQGNFHIAEISVAQDFQGRGIGGALMRTMFEQIQREGYKYITLTTFKDVPWNGPWYKKMGFKEISPRAMKKQYTEILKDEAARGMDPDRRCIMRKIL
ncbi:Acyl-CoA N-acyltransferases (Nat) [Glarea lozoyensis ATCC 20868]|uniref:Acyl-CoA N-acyltransferases (Nat) n=1 Tax=Glarea lozoyensis (strain ATCC 20868 / MF5171) TaxID=1116229 RepID=S3CCY6_GLAL2|nr:Acyl-CoA N-acyltransferases (Nat) [Glarea lozoyensis ATCC 20868]EPE24397.1 Acyl-CoA N-acyltransferases (Nat) [Glarea lozoyensis ATCC 20868]